MDPNVSLCWSDPSSRTCGDGQEALRQGASDRPETTASNFVRADFLLNVCIGTGTFPLAMH